MEQYHIVYDPNTRIITMTDKLTTVIKKDFLNTVCSKDRIYKVYVEAPNFASAAVTGITLIEDEIRQVLK